MSSDDPNDEMYDDDGRCGAPIGVVTTLLRRWAVLLNDDSLLRLCAFSERGSSLETVLWDEMARRELRFALLCDIDCERSSRHSYESAIAYVKARTERCWLCPAEWCNHDRIGHRNESDRGAPRCSLPIVEGAFGPDEFSTADARACHAWEWVLNGCELFPVETPITLGACLTTIAPACHDRL